MNNLKVVWICSFSNEKVRSKLPIRVGFFKRIVYRLMGKSISKGTDSAIWNSNAIDEFKAIEDVKLHVICPVRGLSKNEVRFIDEGIHYYFFREQNSNVLKFVIHQLFTKHTSEYKKNRRCIKKYIDEIHPDIVHVMGAENPFYSLAILDIPKEIPTIIQLQALLIRLVNKTNDKKKNKEYYYKGLFEKRIIQRADYIGTVSRTFRDYIVREIKSEAKFLDISLTMAQKINLEPVQKEYDFVYFASNIRKAGAEALEAFILARKEFEGISLDIIGQYDEGYKKKLDQRINECGLERAVTFEGRLPTHDDVIKQIRKSRFALLPLKLDFVPNTVREAMANGLPVITTITDGTPRLNQECQCVLLSAQGDYQAMANNMMKLLNDEKLALELRNNAAQAEEKRSNNHDIIQNWCEAYKSICKP